MEEFLLASAADPPVPGEVAERMSRKCPPEALALVRTVLWLLGTRLGSLALCGARCLSWRFPFVRRFDELPLEQREALLRRWSRQTLLPPLRMFFLITKAFCLHVFYSWVSLQLPIILVVRRRRGRNTVASNHKLARNML